MPAALSVVIPTLNAARALPATTDALLEGVTDGLIAELIISDGGSTDDTITAASELGARIIEGAPGRGGQIARGIDQASTDWVLILHADTHLSEGWAMSARAHMADFPDSAGWFHLRFRATGVWPRLVASGANLRARVLKLPYGDQGLLVRRSVLEASGGVPNIPIMEDVELARRLKHRLRPLPGWAETSAERYERSGWARRVSRNLFTLVRYKLGAKPENLAVSYDQ